MTKRHYFRTHKQIELKRRLDSLSKKARRRVIRNKLEKNILDFEAKHISEISSLAEALAGKV